jgi:hypothetical protein
MLRKICLAAVAATALAPVLPAAFATGTASTPSLIGDWNFASGSGLDTTGNWTGFQLHGDATITDGQLTVAGPTTPTNYAQATAWAEASGYQGSTITDKTMISWVKLDATSPTGGSPISLFNLPGGYKFDAVDYGEFGGNQWVAGSEGGFRSGWFSPGYSDTNTTSLRQVALSYHSNGDGSQTITGCLNGVQLGSYRTGTTSFDSSTQVLFGPRHEGPDGSGHLVPVGAINAHITESRLYNVALTCTQVAALYDETAPTFDSVVDDRSYEATSTAGAVGSWTIPTATDNLDPSPQVSCDHQPGETYPLGQTTVTCTATDASNNTAKQSFVVTVAYGFSGILQPINADGSSVFRAGSTVPVKFALTGASAGISNAVATLTVVYGTSGVGGTAVETVSTSAATTGNLFRYDATSGQYIFNWSTKGRAAGTYVLTADLGSGGSHAVQVSLK